MDLFPQVLQEQYVKYIESCKISDRNGVHVQKINNTKLSIHDMTLQRIEQFLKYSTSKSIVVEVWNTSTLD